MKQSGRDTPECDSPLLRICTFCDRVRTTCGNWKATPERQRPDVYRVSHGLCRTCWAEVYSPLYGWPTPEEVGEV